MSNGINIAILCGLTDLTPPELTTNVNDAHVRGDVFSRLRDVLTHKEEEGTFSPYEAIVRIKDMSNDYGNILKEPYAGYDIKHDDYLIGTYVWYVSQLHDTYVTTDGYVDSPKYNVVKRRYTYTEFLSITDNMTIVDLELASVRSEMNTLLLKFQEYPTNVTVSSDGSSMLLVFNTKEKTYPMTINFGVDVLYKILFGSDDV